MSNKSSVTTNILKGKVTDYKRFAFILLALSVFMFIGLIVPNEGVSQMQQMILIILSITSIVFAFIFHKMAMKFREQLFNEEE
ncbi:YrhC family protein [Anaerobacillus arseniciselenatis]|uniref:YrhC family protein n=1 Tax=Anaerobacillus arseniciselenatis TaxID=85682 RepID=UPI001B806078|nr:YrhC family protein [Anaerobacillus arseniciselenatis]